MYLEFYCRLSVVINSSCHRCMASTRSRVKASVAAQFEPSRLNTRERLIFSQAVHEFGSDAWIEISKLLSKHPLISRPKGTFNPQVSSHMYSSGYVGCILISFLYPVLSRDLSLPHARGRTRQVIVSTIRSSSTADSILSASAPELVVQSVGLRIHGT